MLKAAHKETGKIFLYKEKIMTEQQQEKLKVTLDDKDYIVEDMTPDGQYIVQLLASLSQKETNLKMELDQVLAAKDTLTNKLREELTKEKEEDDA